MEYRTILVQADPSNHSADRIRLAALLAIDLNAHLVGVATTGISRYVCPNGGAGSGDLIAGYPDPLFAQASQCLDEFEHLVTAIGVPSWERRLVKDQPDEGLARHARFADLAVLSRNDPAGPTSDAVTSLPQYVVLNCARPVLILPCGQPPSSIGTQALIAWNGSMEAALAMTGAIPLLRLARQTTVAVFEPAGDASASSADVQAYLARHGIHAAVQIRRAEGDAGVAILNAARELQCDLMVMGCYGHSKFRELVLGGVSRTILETATVPVLMAH